MSPERVARLHCHFELGRRLALESDENHPPINNPSDIAIIFGPRLRDLDVEEFHIGVLDVQQRLTRRILVTRGVLDNTAIHAREVFRSAIDACAHEIVLVHNHPGGDPTPSPFDSDVTEDLVEAGDLLGIPVYDHVVIGRDRYFSFKEQKCL